jgi:hypothetical protein
MKTEQLESIQIGPDLFALDHSPQSWGISDSVPGCYDCEQSLHSLFNSPPKTAEVTCGCEEVRVKIHQM